MTYKILDKASIPQYIGQLPEVMELLGAGDDFDGGPGGAVGSHRLR